MSSEPVTRPAVGDELELRVDSLAFGGAGVARLSGYVVFVDGAFPGDLVRARVHHRKRAYAQARAIELLEPGPDRVPALADHPGAPWQELAYERQLEIKQSQVEEALRRIGHLDGFELAPIVPAVEQWRYRNKLEYSFGGADGAGLLLGFHEPGSWEQIHHVEDCLLASEAGNRARAEVLDWCRAQRLQPFDRRAHSGFLRNLVVREGRRTGQIQIRLITAPGELDSASLAGAVHADSLLWTRTDALAETSSGGQTALLAGAPTIDEELGGLVLQISSEAFFQTNTEMAERLYALAREACDLHGWERVFDLYCGTGTIGLGLAGRAGHVDGLELVESAVADAIANAKRNDVANASFYAGDVRLAMRELRERAGRPDVVVVDPPRAGLSQKVVRRIIETAPRRIVYVSCNPTTLAPNAAQLTEAGWRLERVVAVDMFPQTPHIECVALLTR
ncbi:MAG TPA: 23S rRNA (uracil(1939)-C(5))-methyltransferase RlmD [Solirubrobacteraceae bacterium]|nr:23S rRNA (uracil(1939)-C(5))-methyltransferase RlmD [Solirubrobacteraceae bacterium]